MVEGDAGRTQMAFTVSLSQPSAQTITVCYATEEVVGGAKAGEDFTPAGRDAHLPSR